MEVDFANPLLLMATGIGATAGATSLMFKLLLAEKDKRILYLEEEVRMLRGLAGQSVHNTSEALKVKTQGAV